MEIALIFVSLLVGLIAYVVIISRRQQRLFEERFPPITDGEFLAKCTPGTDPARALKVRRIIADNLGVNYDRLHPSARFAEDIGAD
jgi:hypothetical protein